VILWLTSSFAASYDNVGTYEFKKVTKVRIAVAPPASLNSRETAPPFPSKYAKDAHFRDSSSANRTAENGLLGSEGGHFPGFSLAGTLAVRFQGAHKANAMRPQPRRVGYSGLTFVGSPETGFSASLAV
jgi:hypothetical protein